MLGADSTTICCSSTEFEISEGRYQSSDYPTVNIFVRRTTGKGALTVTVIVSVLRVEKTVPVVSNDYRVTV